MRNIKTLLITACAVAVLQSSGLAAPETYTIDPAHSTIGFKVKHLFSYVTGRFNAVEGTVIVDTDKPESSSVKSTIQASSISTGNEKRDAHLQSADFFDVAKFSTLTFESTGIKQTGPDTADITGNFTMHGVTKPIILKAHFIGKGAGMKPGEIRAGWEATATLKRSDFGLVWNKVIEGTQVVGDDVAINLEIEAVKTL
ncbi:MAG: YceI family protein [Chthoniobacterales bacterium]